ncbi:MAG: hypothetical protein SGI86_06255 [Deltaproteobacteria bacterium]|nr:hypothetical protein [Deltaproteobacteria bacterium]
MGDLNGIQHLVLDPSWSGFGDPGQYLRYALVLLAATASGAILAYHPAYRDKPITMASLDQRKTLIIYSVVGAVIAVICAVHPSMAFVIFGIGGLMRFRTDVGESKSTGHTIMATLLGLCWGLGLWVVAILVTFYFWVMIYVIENSAARVLTVGGLPITEMARSCEAYRKAITRAGCRILGHSNNFKNLQTVFLLKMPKSATIESVAKELQTIPEALRGIPDWPDS